MPAFHVRHIKDLYPMIWNKAGILARALARGKTTTPAWSATSLSTSCTHQRRRHTRPWWWGQR
ncbi:hypothetical protein B0T26DRAFT_333932 [Lasiosphaeria miniovina]|uniref:Uncharacterized protein n=1 Tax=Lasiosphaeria miniovina TaxID=1954250 RepID=A0AA40E0X1_9PEZI|nr:uncharacterized protein B0T26DRAFT_333932 [Lasiosphaeria miniovina]KAK0718608.1 hypothetical protein B0T26DRAFT_333932 [Lasiosphaeria miniovina]